MKDISGARNVLDIQNYLYIIFQYFFKLAHVKHDKGECTNNMLTNIIIHLTKI